MTCQKCGAQLEEGAKFCEMCGAPAAESASALETRNPVSTNTETGQNFYQQNNWRQSNAGDYDVNQRYNTKKIRKWFRNGEGNLIKAIILLVVGFALLLLTDKLGEVIGILFTFAAIIALILGIKELVAALAGGSITEVDLAWNAYADVLAKRGLQKLNVVEEQVEIIDPIVLVGFGDSPHSSFAAAKENAQNQRPSLLARLLSVVFFMFTIIFRIFSIFKRKKLNGTELDPYEARRIGKDDILRSMLMQTTVYRFSEEQLLIYTGNVDISTGLVYSERTEEVFYQDIEGIQFAQSLFKVYSPSKKQYVNKARESIGLYLSGYQVYASVRTDINTSIVQNQFAAMRSLIRDKKNA